MAEQEYLVNAKVQEEVKATMHHLEQPAMIDILRCESNTGFKWKFRMRRKKLISSILCRNCE